MHLAGGTALLPRLEVLLRPRAWESPVIPPRGAGGGLSLCPGRPPTFPAPRPRGPRSRSLREPFGPCAAPVARLLQQVVLVLRGPSPADLASAPASASAAPRRDPQERSPARRCGRQACRSAPRRAASARPPPGRGPVTADALRPAPNARGCAGAAGRGERPRRGQAR